jgi:hypothetical protein
VRYGGDPLTIWCLQDGWTSLELYAAVKKGHTEVVRQLLSRPGINVNATDKVNPLDPWVVWAGIGFLVYVHLQCVRNMA